jgi:hypothetical protein
MPASEMSESIEQACPECGALCLVDDGSYVAIESLPIAPAADAQPVAIVESWTNGSYHRNYKLRWLRDVDSGVQLYAAPTEKVTADAGARDALLGELYYIAREKSKREFIDVARAALAAQPSDAALVDALMLEAEKFWWNDGPERKSTDAMNAAKQALLARLSAQPSDAAAEPVAYTTAERLKKIAERNRHVDTMWPASMRNEGDIPLYTAPQAPSAPAVDALTTGAVEGVEYLGRGIEPPDGDKEHWRRLYLAERECRQQWQASAMLAAHPATSPKAQAPSAPAVDALTTGAVGEAGDAEFLHPATQVYFRAGLLACREYMARFVECDSPIHAASIRANWWPSLGQDFGAPRQLRWDEMTVGEYGEDDFRAKTADEVSPTQEALPIALQFLLSLDPGNRRKSVTIDMGLEQSLMRGLSNPASEPQSEAIKSAYRRGFMAGWNGEGEALSASEPKAPAPSVEQPLSDEQIETLIRMHFITMKDDEGQGLHPYYKDAFRDGAKFARALQPAHTAGGQS